MTIGARSFVGTAAALRDAFDASFARPLGAEGTRGASYLVIRIGDEPCAVRLSDVAGIHADRKIVPVASPLDELLGIAAFRGVLAPVYDLGKLLGHPADRTPRWMILAQPRSLVGLAFRAFEAHVNAPEAALSLPDECTGRNHVCGALRIDDRTLPLLDLNPILDGIARRVETSGPSKEQ